MSQGKTQATALGIELPGQQNLDFNTSSPAETGSKTKTSHIRRAVSQVKMAVTASVYLAALFQVVRNEQHGEACIFEASFHASPLYASPDRHNCPHAGILSFITLRAP